MLLPWGGSRKRGRLFLLNINGGNDMRKIDIVRLPELATRVGIHGSVKQKEVGGAACVAAVIALIAA